MKFIRPSIFAYIFLGSFLTTIFFLQWWQRSSYDKYIITLVVVIVIAAITSVRCRTASVFIITSCLGVTLALMSVARTTHVSTSLTIDTYANGDYVELTGRIVAEPDRRPMQTKYTIATEQITFLGSGTIITPVHGKVLVTDRRLWPEFQYGDHVTVRGSLEKPGQVETFHYDRYLSRFGVYAVMYRGSVKGLEGRNGRKVIDPSAFQTFLPSLFKMKATFESQINRLYGEPHASFMAGLLTGSRRGIPEKLMENFNVTGLTHIIAISGYNITIVISIITGLLFWLPLKWRFVPAVLAIVAFTLFVGASAAVVRAAIMGCLGLLALQLGRQSHVRLGVLWTAFAMLCFNPKYLWYDAGFQLSFLAVIGLVELAPLLDRWFERIPAILGLREAFQMTCAAQLSAVPLIILLFGRLSLIAPVANVLVAPLIPLAMLFGFLGTMVSFVWFFGGQVIAYLGWGCLEWIVQVATRLSEIPYASVEVPQIDAMVVGAYYVMLVSWILHHQMKAGRSSHHSYTKIFLSRLCITVSTFVG